MTDYIERDAAIKAIDEAYPTDCWGIVELKQLPAADVKPVVRGRNVSDSGFMCSVCTFGDFGGFHGYKPHYCPNCGAKMVITFEGCVPLDNAKLEDADFSLADRIRKEGEG